MFQGVQLPYCGAKGSPSVALESFLVCPDIIFWTIFFSCHILGVGTPQKMPKMGPRRVIEGFDQSPMDSRL